MTMTSLAVAGGGGIPTSGAAIPNGAGGGSLDDFHYEGAEKTLEIHFGAAAAAAQGEDDYADGGGGASHTPSSSSLLSLPQSTWDAILDTAKCKILSKISNPHVDCYVLSESSLFVYADRLFLKTCGMTILLNCLRPLLSAVQAQLPQLELEWLRFSRKNFVYPQDQQSPHTSFDQETQFCLETLFPTQACSAHVLGDLLSDHWNVLYVDQRAVRPSPLLGISPQRSNSSSTNSNKENIVNFMMYGIDPAVARNFYPASPAETQQQARARVFRDAKFDLLFDAPQEDASFQHDSFMFHPCGFSLNAIVHERYYVTIHITPESKFSYASFETNLPQRDGGDEGYAKLLEAVLAVFSPRTCTVGLFSDSKHPSSFDCREDYGYRRVSHESARIQNLFYAEMSSFERV